MTKKYRYTLKSIVVFLFTSIRVILTIDIYKAKKGISYQKERSREQLPITKLLIFYFCRKKIKKFEKNIFISQITIN